MTTLLQYSDIFPTSRANMDHMQGNTSSLSLQPSTNTNVSSMGDFWKNLGIGNLSSNSGGANEGGCNIHVSEEVTIAVTLAVERFLRKNEERELQLPSSFTSVERAYVHKLARAVGLTSKSSGFGVNRALTIYKPDMALLSQKPSLFTLTWNSRRAISQLIQTNPVTSKEKLDLQPRTDRNQGMDRDHCPYSTGTREERQRCITGKLMGAVPQVPPPRRALSDTILAEVTAARGLPVWKKKSEILRLIGDYQVVIISGVSGSGKTTQIPQMLMEEMAARDQLCRMICTEPRRLAAHANAERVAAERNESVGQTVGYQIRLESKVSPGTLLTFCTNGVLLRTLYADSHFLSGTTHIIVDEVQERDRYADLLLMVLRGMLKTHRHLRLVLLLSNVNSPATIAQMNSTVQMFQEYFERCPVVYLPEKKIEVREYFLEYILSWLDYYWDEEVKNSKETIQKDEERRQIVKDWVDLISVSEPTAGSSGSDSSSSSSPASSYKTSYDLTSKSTASFNKYGNNPAGDSAMIFADMEESQIMENRGQPLQRSNPILAIEVDRLLYEIWCGNSHNQIFRSSLLDIEGNNVQILLDLVNSERVPPDHEHGLSGLTPLMVCAARGYFMAVEQLLSLGANPFLRTPAPRLPSVNDPGVIGSSSDATSASGDVDLAGMTALDWANYYRHLDVARYIRAFMEAASQVQTGEKKEANFLRFGSLSKLCSSDTELLSSYQTSLPFEDFIDYQLIIKLLRKIDQTCAEGSVLIFLPSYDDINNLRELLLDSDNGGFGDTNKHLVYILHSRMLVNDLKRVYTPSPQGIRKIVLSTSIAECCTTIEDIVYVIDVGKEKKKMIDNVTEATTFRSEWISQSNVLQRKTRAGRYRCGSCYHLFSRFRYEKMASNPVSEMHTQSLEDLCLQSKLLTPRELTIPEYLSMVVEPPSFVSCKNSVKLLKEIGSLDSFDDLTELGYHLCDLPIEPRYGKMVLCSVALKCLDPILTIACILSYSEPFTIPKTATERRESMLARHKFAAETPSDHMVLLRAFQMWQKARAEGWEKSFCQKNFISSAAFEVITGIRTQLLGQLRASGFVKARGSGDIRDLNLNSENWAVVKAALLSGMFSNMVRFDREHLCLVSAKHSKLKQIRFHPHSVLACTDKGERLPLSSLQCDWLLYDEALVVDNCAQVRCATLVSPVTVALLGGQSRMKPELLRETENAIFDFQSNQSSAGSTLQQSQQSSNQSSSSSNYLEFSNSNNQQTSGSAAMTSGSPSNSTGELGAGGGSSGGPTLDSDSESEEEQRNGDANKRVPFRLDDSLHFKLDCESAQMLLQLRYKWHALFLRRLRNPGKQCTPQDEAVLRALISVLTSEEHTLGLRQPSGVGARPRPMAPESCNQLEFNSNSSLGMSPSVNLSNKTLITEKTDSPIVTIDSPSSSFSNRMQQPHLINNQLNFDSVEFGGYYSPPLNTRQPQSIGHSSRFFMVRFTNRAQIELASSKNIYAVTKATERKILTTIREDKVTYLIFLSDADSCFCGYAIVKSFLGLNERPLDLSPVLNDWALFTIEWIRRLPVPYTAALNLSNPWTSNTKLHMSKDGQELDPLVGDHLINILNSASSGGSHWMSAGTGNSSLLLHATNNNLNIGSPSIQQINRPRMHPGTSQNVQSAPQGGASCNSQPSSHMGMSPHHPPPPPSLWIARTPPGPHSGPHPGFAPPPPPPQMAPMHTYGPPPPFPGITCYGAPQSPGIMFPSGGMSHQTSQVNSGPPNHSQQAPIIFKGLPPRPSQSYQTTPQRH